MLLRIEFEAVNSWIDGGTITHWHVDEGGAVRFGEPLCDITVDEVYLQRRSQHFSKMLREKFPRTYKESRKASIGVRLTSADDGTVTTIRKAVGSKVRVGELLAVAAAGSRADAPVDEAAVEQAPRFRVVADVLGVDAGGWNE